MGKKLTTYNIVLIARKSQENRCYAESGEVLAFASPHDKIKRRLPGDEHFFVGLETRQGARYGWVENAAKPMTVEEFRAADIASQLAVLGEIKESPLELYESFLETINRFEVGTTLAAGWLDIVGIDASKKRKLQFHKVFFRSGKTA